MGDRDYDFEQRVAEARREHGMSRETAEREALASMLAEWMRCMALLAVADDTACVGREDVTESYCIRGAGQSGVPTSGLSSRFLPQASQFTADTRNRTTRPGGDEPLGSTGRAGQNLTQSIPERATRATATRDQGGAERRSKPLRVVC